MPANRARLIGRAAAPPRQSDERSERRGHRRVPYSELPAPPLVRIPSRGSIALVDLSPGGALLELPFQLTAESRISLELKTSSAQLVVPFQLLRCYIADLKNGVRYRAAGAFERALKLPSPTDGGLWPVSSDPLLEALEVFQRASHAMDLRSQGTCFNELLEWTVTVVRRGEPANVASAKIKAHLRRLFPSLAIGHASSCWSPETSTFVQFFDLGFRSKAPLTSSDRRFLKASAQLMSLLCTPSEFSVVETRESVGVPASNPCPEIVHTVTDWMEMGRSSACPAPYSPAQK